jgi:hypothetical protein
MNAAQGTAAGSGAEHRTGLSALTLTADHTGHKKKRRDPPSAVAGELKTPRVIFYFNVPEL